jgi:hypothetical protein
MALSTPELGSMGGRGIGLRLVVDSEPGSIGRMGLLSEYSL